ncbi:thiamine phosphate synthase [Ramlibacter sp. G-1-2-2]|uniref:Thiamine phosphate synthase n=1 Tax=Ramlibacter agri TaxID=2728837 RepID=A0A848H923_9BURK|nr:thiamine phosphate synthase [Ramlibacter agri]NML46994.1 thiamine phosphate synthase [Ramlibacter agri]
MNDRQLVVVDAAQFGGRLPADLPAIARELAQQGQDVCIARVLHADGRMLHWMQAEHACGWLEAQGSGAALAVDALAQRAREALARGFVAADALVLAVWQPGEPLPWLSWGELPPRPPQPPAVLPPLDLYAIVDSAARMRQVLAAGVRTVQIRIKTPDARLRAELQQCIADCAAAGARLFVNDHWQLAHELGAKGIHLGQSDLVELGEEGRAAVLATGMELGVSSHALWELCRARTLSPAYIACGPVWPTTTKDMPWVPQGLDNLAWWVSVAGRPVTSIGGILEVEQVKLAASTGAEGVCIVRGLGDDPSQVVPVLRSALEEGRRSPMPAPAYPHPTL